MWIAQNRINAVQGPVSLNTGLQIIFRLAEKKGNFRTSRAALIFSERAALHGNISLFILFPRYFC